MKKWLYIVTLVVYFNCEVFGEPALYWTDTSTDEIYRSNLDGSAVTSILNTGTDTEPRGIAIDDVHEKIYWTEDRSATIKRANIDGTNVSTIINVGSAGCGGFDIDYSSNQIYYTELRWGINDKLKRANLSGSNITTIKTFSGSGGPSGIALDINSGRMYWTICTSYDDYIQRANLDGSDVQMVVIAGRNPWDIKLDLAGGKTYWTEYGGEGPGNGSVCRANLDGAGGREVLVSGLNDPYGLALDLSLGKIYWADNGAGKIQCANLDGTGVTDILTGLESPFGLAIGVVPEPTSLLFFALGSMVLRLRKR
jgi:DNA-binding beta-propeller fold protein YncE